MILFYIQSIPKNALLAGARIVRSFCLHYIPIMPLSDACRLRDDSPQVRMNTMKIMTRLILNDMVKVKGQISEIATCLQDEDSRIAELAKCFFAELSKKVVTCSSRHVFLRPVTHAMRLYLQSIALKISQNEKRCLYLGLKP